MVPHWSLQKSSKLGWVKVGVQSKWLLLKMTKIYGPLVQNLHPFPKYHGGWWSVDSWHPALAVQGQLGSLEAKKMAIWAVSETELWRLHGGIVSPVSASRKPQGLINNSHIHQSGPFFQAFTIYLGLSKTRDPQKCWLLGQHDNEMAPWAANRVGSISTLWGSKGFSLWRWVIHEVPAMEGVVYLYSY